MFTVPDEDILYNNEDIIPFPETDDQLFTTEKSSYYNAQITYRYSKDSLYRYVVGYKEAADRLVQFVLANSRHLDFVIFPTVFLYRQYLELRLKQLLVEGSKLLDRSFTLPKHHRVDSLWYECKKLLKQKEPNMTDGNVAGLEGCIIEFSIIHPTSMAFRYHIDTHDNPSLPSDLEYINNRNLAKIMAKIDSFLDAVYMTISVSLGQKYEMEAAYRDYYPSEEDWRDYYGILNEEDFSGFQ